MGVTLQTPASRRVGIGKGRGIKGKRKGRGRGKGGGGTFHLEDLRPTPKP